MVVSQSCDLVHHDLTSEPWCETLRLKCIPQSNGIFEYGRNARRLHLNTRLSDTEHACEAFAHDRFVLPRVQLCEQPPLANHFLDDPTLLADWFGRRYSRPALPDSFNRRIKSQIKLLTPLLKAHHVLFRDFYLRLSTTRELPDDEIYKLKLLLVPEADVDSKSVQEVTSELQKILSFASPKLDIVDVTILTDDKVTLRLLADYIPWDIFDYLTTRDEAAG